jgi:hypothetical protein
LQQSSLAELPPFLTPSLFFPLLPFLLTHSLSTSFLRSLPFLPWILRTLLGSSKIVASMIWRSKEREGGNEGGGKGGRKRVKKEGERERSEGAHNHRAGEEQRQSGSGGGTAAARQRTYTSEC